MGEYADLAAEQAFQEYIDIKFDDQEFYDEWEGNDIPTFYVDSFSRFEFKTIKKETEKAWLLVMSGDAEIWFPKSRCKIVDKMILVARNELGNLYMVDIIADNLVQIDKTTAAATVIGPIGFSANYAQDMEFDNSAKLVS